MNLDGDDFHLPSTLLTLKLINPKNGNGKNKREVEIIDAKIFPSSLRNLELDGKFYLTGCLPEYLFALSISDGSSVQSCQVVHQVHTLNLQGSFFPFTSGLNRQALEVLTWTFCPRAVQLPDLQTYERLRILKIGTDVTCALPPSIEEIECDAFEPQEDGLCLKNLRLLQMKFSSKGAYFLSNYCTRLTTLQVDLDMENPRDRGTHVRFFSSIRKLTLPLNYCFKWEWASVDDLLKNFNPNTHAALECVSGNEISLDVEILAFTLMCSPRVSIYFQTQFGAIMQLFLRSSLLKVCFLEGCERWTLLNRGQIRAIVNLCFQTSFFRSFTSNLTEQLERMPNSIGEEDDWKLEKMTIARKSRFHSWTVLFECILCHAETTLEKDVAMCDSYQYLMCKCCACLLKTCASCLDFQKTNK